MTSKEDQIFVRVRNNDYSGFNELFHKYYGRLCDFATQFLHDRDAAEDVVQEVFVRLWDIRNKLVIRERISAYLYKATRNACLNQIRADKNKHESIDNVDLPTNPDEKEWVEDEEFISYLNSCIDQLPGRSRQVFIMNRFEGVKLPDISDQLGTSVKTIKNQLWKSMQYLKTCLEQKRVF